MISAREALTSIERAIQGVRRDEDRILALLRETTAEGDRLRSERAEGFRALARIRLDALARDEVVGELDQAERRALELLDRRRGAVDAIADRRKALSARLDAAEEDREARAAARDGAIEAIEALSAKVEARIADDPAWKAADEAVRRAETVAAESDRKAAQAEADREEKRKPYEADSLFMYLWNRGFGTPAYSAGPLARWLDGKVAALIGYEHARPNYYMLNEIPKRLREHATRVAADLPGAVAAREAVERAALEAAGAKALEKKAEEIAAHLAEAEAAVEKIKADLAGLDDEARGALDETANPEVKGALDGLAAAIAREDLRSLFREAQATPTPEDEAIVQKLLDVERALVRVDAQMEELRKTSLDLAGRRTELEHSGESFRKSGYDDPFGGFINEAVIGGVIEGIIRGALSSGKLEEALGDGFRRRSPRLDRGGFGGGLRIPSMPRGGSQPPRSSGGGGFRTGGSF
ncbi:hypothetical protein [Chthonobacter albigriseus]|uniref:hypothetical protein n=1 Tax=Chthonobacter albigriseus TaxID=1683161 RepID=UPI0015EF61F5|nr:hypothetical protein [Chthonobacter albigriseus]